MLVIDILINVVAIHRYLLFIDSYLDYNQILIAKEDVAKKTFRFPRAIGTYKWLVMPFDFKNTRATSQRVMKLIFHDFNRKFIEFYIDDIVVKSSDTNYYLTNQYQNFTRMRQHQLGLNPLKCVIGVKAGNFLSFLFHQ